MSQEYNKKLATRVSFHTIIWNIILTVFKLFAGIFAHSAAMISDAIHSFSDVLSTVVVIIGIRLANKSSDEAHQYGHERFECIAAIILALMLAITGLGIGLSGVKSILGASNNLKTPGTLALIAAVVSIIVKEIMFYYTRWAAKKINSGALLADAWHHRSDSLSSIGSFVGILGARMGFPILDPLASIIICVFVVKVSIDIFRDSAQKLTDKACDKDTIDKIKEITLSKEGVMGIDDLKTRRFGDKIYIDLEISADGNISLTDAHDIAEDVHDSIEQEIENVKHCMVHINPYLEN